MKLSRKIRYISVLCMLLAGLGAFFFQLTAFILTNLLGRKISWTDNLWALITILILLWFVRSRIVILVKEEKNTGT